MQVPVKIGAMIRTYPYRERLPVALVWAAVTGWFGYYHDLWRFASFDSILSDVAVFLALLCTWKGRPFWLFVGIAAGAWLIVAVRLLHTAVGPFFLKGLVVMVVVVWLLRKL